ncbi:hypothetical protein KQX54_004516 [Cotesia glomerata]|uniref:Uncharacterized protein n=1 Tax=Cotesia glomerata TaxID=32391 RepID=A0AAV7I3M2_COTGL|nr:hypothetical protein KQX54_004516 [Cotesia glomerata]
MNSTETGMSIRRKEMRYFHWKGLKNFNLKLPHQVLSFTFSPSVKKAAEIFSSAVQSLRSEPSDSSIARFVDQRVVQPVREQTAGRYSKKEQAFRSSEHPFDRPFILR